MSSWQTLCFPMENADMAKELFAMYNATVRILSNWSVELSYEGRFLNLGSANQKELVHCANWLKTQLS